MCQVLSGRGVRNAAQGGPGAAPTLPGLSDLRSRMQVQGDYYYGDIGLGVWCLEFACCDSNVMIFGQWVMSGRLKSFAVTYVLQIFPIRNRFNPYSEIQNPNSKIRKVFAIRNPQSAIRNQEIRNHDHPKSIQSITPVLHYSGIV